MTKEDYDPDFEISKRYIEFSAELLRLSLLAITGICYLFFVSNYFNDKTPNLFCLVALGLFIITICFALAHRYYATDSLTSLILILRKKETEEKMKLERQLKLSEKYLKYCQYFFVFAICFAFVRLIFSKFK